jgi:hypothetical protein
MKFFQTIPNHFAAAKVIATFGIIFFFTLVGQSQSLNCTVANSIDFTKNYGTMPTATIKVNFHFLPINPVIARPDDPTQAHEYTMPEAEFLSNALISFANQNFENLQHANQSQFYPMTMPHVSNAKIKLELYDGGLGSIFLYSGPGKTHLNTTHTPRYGRNNVVDIVITYANDAQNTGFKDFALVTLANFNQLLILTDVNSQEDRARLLCHEIGHVLNLEHSFKCGQCNSEINHTVECGGNCSCDTPGNPSNNLMSYKTMGNDEITPCQWATMFNHILFTESRFVIWDCQKKATPLVITGSVTWSNLRIIDRDVIIPSGSALSIGCEVRFVENCKIQVQSGGTLFLDYAKLIPFCYPHWAGIESQGYVSIQNSTLEHALTAVSISDGYFSSNNTIFRNNMRDIEYLNKPDGSTHNYTNCTFEINNNYRIMGSNSMIRSRVTMYNSEGIRFNGCTFVNNISDPSQYSWNVDYDFQGIYAVGSAFEVKGNGSTETTFTNFFAGIRSASLGVARTVNITKSVFDKNFAGVISDNTTGLVVQDNKFNVRWNNSFPNYNWYRTGILINTGSMFTIKNNRFDGISTQSGQYTFGALVVNTGESENKIESNKFSNLYVGIRALQKNTNSSSADPMGLHLKCGNFKDNFYDYTVEQDGYSDGGIRNIQGANGEGDGNLFSKNGSPVDIWSDAVGNPFFRNYQILPMSKSVASVNDPNIVNQVTDLTGEGWTPNCNIIEMMMSDQQNTGVESLLSDSLYITELSDAEIRQWASLFETADNTLKNSKTQHANLLDGGNQGALLSNIRSRWHRDTALLRSNLLAQSPNLSTTVLLDVLQLGTLKKQTLMQILLANPSSCREPKFLKKLKQNYATIFSDNDLQTLRNAPLSMSNRFRLENGINIHSSQRAEAAKILVHHYLVHSDVRKQELRRWLENLGSRHAQYSLAETFIAESESNRYAAQLRNLSRDLAYSASYTQENEDYVELYGIKSQILKSGRSLRKLNPSEIERIRRIANNTKGDAAVQANTILCIAIGECKQLEISRLPTSLGVVPNTNQNSERFRNTTAYESIFVHPNPTSGSLSINFEIQKAFTEGSMSLMDLTGKVVLQQKIDKNQKQIVWQTDNIERGLYFVLLRIDNRIVSQTKVLVQK